jgi:hypothetical protein
VSARTPLIFNSYPDGHGQIFDIFWEKIIKLSISELCTFLTNSFFLAVFQKEVLIQKKC